MTVVCMYDCFSGLMGTESEWSKRILHQENEFVAKVIQELLERVASNMPCSKACQ